MTRDGCNTYWLGVYSKEEDEEGEEEQEEEKKMWIFFFFLKSRAMFWCLLLPIPFPSADPFRKKYK